MQNHVLKQLRVVTMGKGKIRFKNIITGNYFLGHLSKVYLWGSFMSLYLFKVVIWFCV